MNDVFVDQDGRYGLYAPATGGMEMLDLRTGKVCKTLIPKISEGIFDVMAVFNATNEYVLYYHSGRKTIRAFRRKDGIMITNFRVQADLKGMETTADGREVTTTALLYGNKLVKDQVSYVTSHLLHYNYALRFSGICLFAHCFQKWMTMLGVVLTV